MMRLWPFGKRAEKALMPVDSHGGWFQIVKESFTGAWQQNVEIDRPSVLAYFAVYSCITLISGDLGKLRIKLVELTDGGIWKEVDGNSPFAPVLSRPNRYQTRQKFVEQWISSKLIHGNAYALKERDARGIVRQLYVLDPQRVRPLVAPDGAVYYQLDGDDLAQVPDGGLPAVPASEIIHDTMICMFHPLVGVSPLYACGLAAMQGLGIQNNSTRFFQNSSRPGGILTAPGAITDEQSKKMRERWNENYGGANQGKVAVLGNGLSYQAIAVTAVDAQMVEQLKMTAESVASTFHVPAYKIGVGPTPTYQNAEILNQIYYSDCLQTIITAFQSCMVAGLGLDNVSGKTLGIHLDLDDLMRMDNQSRVKAASDSIGSAAMSPNEARARWLNLPGVEGGDSPYLQQQNFSLSALSKRDANDPFSKPAEAPAAPIQDPPAVSEELRAVADMFNKAMECTTT